MAEESLEKLTKKQRRELRKQEKAQVRQKNERNRLIRKLLIWGSGIAIVVLAIGGMIYLVSSSDSPAPQDSQALLKVKEDDWTQGTANAPVTLIEYLDFQCPACGGYFPVVKTLRQEYGDRVLFVTRHLPLVQIHQNAMPAAKAAEAAGKQGKFWEMHDLLFEKQKEWSEVRDELDLFISYAQVLGLNKDKFLADYNNDALEQEIEKDINSAFAVGVRSTPTFFLNGEKIENPQGYEEFKSIIEKELEKTGK